MKYDLHVHSFYSKKCGYMNPKDIVKIAIKKGLDGIAITDHDTIKGGLKAKEYESKDFKVIIGSEIMTNRGEVIGLFLSEEIKSTNFESVIFEIRNQNGLSIIPHPFDESRNSALHPVIGDIKLIDGIEVFNSRCIFEKYNINAKKFATKYNLVATAGSDAHFSNEIGNGGIVTENENIMEAITKNQITAFGKRSPFINHILTKSLKLFR